MMLHANKLILNDLSGNLIEIEAGMSDSFMKTLKTLEELSMH